MKFGILTMAAICGAFPTRGTRDTPQTLSLAQNLHIYSNSAKNYHNEKVNNFFIFLDQLAPVYTYLRSSGVLFIIFYLVLFLIFFIVLSRTFRFFFYLFSKNPQKSDPNFTIENFNFALCPSVPQEKTSEIPVKIENFQSQLAKFKSSLVDFQTQIFVSHSSIWSHLSKFSIN